MQVRQIGIRSSNARVNVQTRPAQVRVENRPAGLSIKSPPAQVSVNTTPGRLAVDSTAARASMGYRHLLPLNSELAGYAGRQYDRGISDKVAAGYRLAAVENGGNPIADLAFDRQFTDYRDRQFVLAMIPRVPPAIGYAPGRTRISFTQHRPEVQVQPNRPIINIEPASVSIDVTPAEIRLYLREPSTIDLTV